MSVRIIRLFIFLALLKTVLWGTVLNAAPTTAGAPTTSTAPTTRPAAVEQWDAFDLALPGPANDVSGNPFDVKIAAKFTSVSTTFEVHGFYDGNGRLGEPPLNELQEQTFGLPEGIAVQPNPHGSPSDLLREGQRPAAVPVRSTRHGDHGENRMGLRPVRPAVGTAATIRRPSVPGRRAFTSCRSCSFAFR